MILKKKTQQTTKIPLKFKVAKLIYRDIDISLRDLFHVYLNRFEFLFLQLHIIKTNKFYFVMHNGRVLGIAK